MKNFRCPKCGRLGFKYNLQGNLSLEIKCSKCNTLIESTITEYRIDKF